MENVQAIDANIVVYLLGLAVMWGSLQVRISHLEKKVEKHNNLVERTAVLERDVKTAFTRCDELRDDLHDVREAAK